MILEEARAVVSAGPVCDSCLGRVFATRSHGLSNTQRGRSLRITLALEDDEPFESPDECWVCESVSSEVEEWANWAANELAGIEFETYQVGTRVPPIIEENDKLLREDAGFDADAGEPFNREMNREVGKVLGSRFDAEVDFERPDVVILVDLEADAVNVRINSGFIYGRYRKLVRGISQTEWPCRECDGSGTREGESCGHCGGTGYMYEESVEGLIGPPIRTAMAGSDATFHGAGREDVDARMLGTGRPFVVEVGEPRTRFPALDQLEETVNQHAAGKVEVEGLANATYEMVERVKELPASKTYRVEIEFDDTVADAVFHDALDALTGATIDQKTPRRVTHRRSDRTRTRTVFAADGSLEDDHHAVVEIHGEGGLYIKELLHGDRSRTSPNLAELLGVGVSVQSLDVTAVEAEDGIFEDPAYLRDPP